MQSKDLRIGNLILNHKDETETVIAIGMNKYIWFDKERNLLDKLCKGLKLTKQHLLDCDFEELGLAFVKNDSIIIWIENDKFLFYLKSHNGTEIKRYIEYFHELQNLYFALTGEELELKSETKP